MSQVNQPESYRKTQIDTASPEMLVLMLYDGALRFTATAEEAFLKKDLEGISNSLLRVQAIIAELLSSLDKEKGGDVAKNLERLYVFFLEKLAEANIKKDPTPLQQIKPLIETLRSTWSDLVRQNTKNPATPSAPSKRLNISA